MPPVPDRFKYRHRKSVELNRIITRGTGIPTQTNRKSPRIAGRFTIYFVCVEDYQFSDETINSLRFIVEVFYSI